MFFIDGLNIYHAIDELDLPHLKWLCLQKLARSIIPQQSEQVEAVIYFSAYPTHLASRYPDKLARHRLYVSALTTGGAQFVKGKFKRKYLTCRANGGCKKDFYTHEEKETDVAIGVFLLEQAFLDRFDVAYILSGDTDFAPAIRRTKVNFPNKELVAVLPPGRKRHKELVQLTDRKIRLTVDVLARCLLPPEIKTPEGTILARPSSYDPPQSV